MKTTHPLIDIDDIRELVRPTEPGVAVYLGPTSDPADDSALEFSLRRRAVGHELIANGADAAIAATVRDRLLGLPDRATEGALFISAEMERFAHPLPGIVPADRVRFGTPIPVAPLLQWLQAHPANVQALVDRAGADLVTTAAGALDGASFTVVGPDDDIRRYFPGGGQAPHLRRRAEDSWHNNAKAVAAVLQTEIDRVQAEAVLIGGDARMVHMVTEGLRHDSATPAIYPLPGGRQLEGSSADRAGATAAAMALHTRRATVSLIERVAAALGPHGHAVSGVAEVLPALAAGLVDTLAIGYDPDDGRKAWFGPDVLCATSRSAAGETPVRSGDLVDIAIRAALLTRAQVWVVRPQDAVGWLDGIAALNRLAR